MSAETDSRKLSDLRVVDLKSELEKRGLDKGGNKQALLERLQKALKDEGQDPETYQFDSDKKVTTRHSTSSNQQENDSVAKEKSAEGEDLNSSDFTDGVDTDTNMTKEDSENKEDTKDTTTDSKVVSKDSNQETTDESKLLLIRDDALSTDMESPLRITLEEEEGFQMDEIELVPDDKIDQKIEETKEDAKNTSNKNQDDAAKAIPDKGEKTKDNKKNEENGSVDGSSSNKSKEKTPRTRNLWITNISKTTKAAELKQVLSSYGKVIGAKVVINARHPGACCYGYVTMETVEDADNCIKHLNNTELNGHVIHLEKVRGDHMHALKMNLSKISVEFKKKKDGEKSSRSTSHHKLPGNRSRSHKEGETKSGTKDASKGKKEDSKRVERKSGKEDGVKSDAPKSDSTKSEVAVTDAPNSDAPKSDAAVLEKSEEKMKSKSHDKDKDKAGDKSKHHSKSDHRSVSKKRGKVLTFDRIKVERDRQRLREKERIIREEDRRRREERDRQREIERLQRSEAARLEREREKLRMEREKLERDKAEIIRLERERQKLEREKLEIERLELQRAKIRLQEEDRRSLKRPPPYRRESPFDDRKRLAGSRHYEETPPPRYEHSSSRIAKDPRYTERERDRPSPPYRPVRDERDRHAILEHKGEMRPSRDHRYGEIPKGFERNNSADWQHPGIAPNKGFPGNAPGPKGWSKDNWRPTDPPNNSERWNPGNMMRGAPSLTTVFPGNANVNMGPSCPPAPSINNYSGDRFDYKSMGNVRKY